MKRILIIGRFQPFHKGHFFLIKKLSKKRNFLEIAIGSANKKNEKNPFNWKTRKEMITKVLARKKIKNFRIFPVNDNESNEKWLFCVLKKSKGFDFVVSENTLVKKIFKGAGFEVKGHLFFKRKIYSGTNIRKRISSGKKWKHLVEKEVAEIIERRRSEHNNKKSLL